jgi:hypothetical protein
MTKLFDWAPDIERISALLTRSTDAGAARRALHSFTAELYQAEAERSLGEDAPHTPTIVVREDLTGMVQEAVRALAGADQGLFVRGRMLVTVARDGSHRDRWLERPPGAPVIVPVSHARLLAMLDAAAVWVKQRRGKLAPSLPPALIATQVQALLEWPVPYLEGVVESPTLRPDGSVLSVPGYDASTALLFEPVPGCEDWPAIPERPTHAEVSAAVEMLLRPVSDFPFVAPSDRSTYVAATLTLLCRHVIDGPVPLFAIRAPAPGTGKGLLAAVIGILGAGREPAVMVDTAESDELRKRITAIALAGTQLVLLDNASGSLGSDVLAGALTARIWEDRVLGASETVRLPLRTVWLATGNNLGFQKTLGRRVLPIDLDAGIENPEDRTDFKYPDLLSHCQAQRQHYAAAALTVVRGFFAAGQPQHGNARIGSFEGWDALIRSAVIWAGLVDPAGAGDPTAGRGRIRAEADDDTEELAQLLLVLERAFGAAQFTAAELWRRSQEDHDLKGELELAAANQKGRITPQSIGYRLREAAGRPIGGLLLVPHAGKRPRRYHVQTKTERSADVDNSGPEGTMGTMWDDVSSPGYSNSTSKSGRVGEKHRPRSFSSSPAPDDETTVTGLRRCRSCGGGLARDDVAGELCFSCRRLRGEG